MPAFAGRTSFFARHLYFLRGYLTPAVFRGKNDRDLSTGGFLRGIAKHALSAGVPHFDVTIRVQHHDAVVLYTLHHQPQTRIRFAEKSFRTLAFGDVDRHAHDEAAPVS